MAGRKSKPTAIKKLECNPGKRKSNTKEPIRATKIPCMVAVNSASSTEKFKNATNQQLYKLF